MSSFYVDTSALAKRYITEKGSAWVRSWTNSTSGNVIIISDLTPVEGFSIFARLRRAGVISAARHARLQAVFSWHVENEYLVTSLDASVMRQAQRFVNQHPLRTLDAIQLASAQYAVSILDEPIRFVSGDTALLTAAASEGFITDDPNLYS